MGALERWKLSLFLVGDFPEQYGDNPDTFAATITGHHLELSAERCPPLYFLAAPTQVSLFQLVSLPICSVCHALSVAAPASSAKSAERRISWRQGPRGFH